MDAWRWFLCLSGTVALCLSLSTACGDDDDSDDPDGATPTPVHWSYEGETGPEQWAELSPEFATCGEGVEQSPVDLAATVRRDLPEIAFDYLPSPLSIQNNGHTIQVAYEAGSSISVGGDSYELVQFHFHAHSEHTIDGETFPLELHLVHRAADERLAVVGVLVQEGVGNPAFDVVFENLPEEESDQPAAVEGASVDALAFLPEGRGYFTYSGSLTTPACSEEVTWIVMSDPVELSASQIATFTTIYDNNYRPTQPLGDREVSETE